MNLEVTGATDLASFSRSLKLAGTLLSAAG
jgi:hypothetical protein